MSVIIIPRKHFRMPQGRLTFAPEWGELVGAAWLPSERRFFGPSFSAFPTIGAGGGIVTAPGPAGLMSRAANTNPISVPSNSEFWRTEFTLVAVFEGGTEGIFFGARGASGIKFGANTGGVIFTEFGIADRGGSFPVVAGKPHVISVNATASSPGKIAADGQVVNSFTSGAFTVQPGTIGILGWVEGASFYDPVLSRGLYNLIVLKRNNLDAALALHEAPYQIYRADPIRIYSFPAGAISLSINSIAASSITQTGARITLGLTR